MPYNQRSVKRGLPESISPEQAVDILEKVLRRLSIFMGEQLRTPWFPPACPRCGKPLSATAEADALRCASCGSSYRLVEGPRNP